MTNINPYLATFDETIKLDWDRTGVLRERRNVILEHLRARLDGPSFDPCNQGSYDLRTGVHPLSGDYDIDVALRFNTTIDEWPDPVALKQRVLAGLEDLGSSVRLRRPCVTVFYRRGDEPLYHVDLAVYARDAHERLHIACGKPGDRPDMRIWQPSDPQALGAFIDGRFKDQDRVQFRRVVRVLKRWKDERFSSEGEAAPRGIALTAAALKWFRVERRQDPVDMRFHYDDAAALLAMVKAMHEYPERRLKAKLPVAPGNDPFERMTERQMEIFREELERLERALTTALGSPDRDGACDVLRRVFGDDFPGPEGKPTRKRSAIVASGSAA
ncbi:cyclic GMP-AMP synthase DncV-like nucleotidyltransferase [Nannocystis bainbridge]|uniref:Cyclic GMP-AMP synthase n=1 Tax=Nannocystis bainbridge TaxID=2995303 RepID=A0ABT5DV32_9BACT|nr:hypothetical protein [Nannocystis bainbridge]MDC0717502.1 hypothetical protein [Nannocystis bainbridge]